MYFAGEHLAYQLPLCHQLTEQTEATQPTASRQVQGQTASQPETKWRDYMWGLCMKGGEVVYKKWHDASDLRVLRRGRSLDGEFLLCGTASWRNWFLDAGLC